MYIATLRGCRPNHTLRASFPPPPLKSICRDKPFPSPKHVASSETTPAVDDPFASSCAAPALRSVDSVSANAVVARAAGGGELQLDRSFCRWNRPLELVFAETTGGARK